jgi:epoxyqueuosine reductase QueG
LGEFHQHEETADEAAKAPPDSRHKPHLTAAQLRTWALDAGFAEAGVLALPYGDEDRNGDRFAEWVRQGRAGSMSYLTRTSELGELLRQRVATPFPWARSVLVCFAPYHAGQPLSTDPAPEGAGWIARYAWSSRIDPQRGRQASDYHKVLLKRLRVLEARLRAACVEIEARAFVDTGPVVERSLAVAAGLGWTGKNTCLIHPKLGSYGFLAVLLTSLELGESQGTREQGNQGTRERGRGGTREQGNEEARERGNQGTRMHCHPERSEGSAFRAPELQQSDQGLKNKPQILRYAQDDSRLGIQPDRCGSCTRCIEACPTGALIAPYQMDATRCIAYLTIEHKGPIAADLMEGMGRQVFGCDICQDVCPWNRKAPISVDAELEARPELVNPAFEALAAIDEAHFERLFNGSPVRRAGFLGLRRNLAIAMGNSGLGRMIPRLKSWSESPDEGLRSAALWALAKLRAATSKAR